MITTIEGETMGGMYRLRVPTSQIFSGLKTMVQSTLDLVDNQMSAWKPNSDLHKFNTSPVGSWVSIPSEMAEVVKIGLEMSEFTNGALNICLGQQSSAFGFAPPITHSSQDVVDPFNALELDTNRTRLRRLVNVALDLNSIAKGFAADLVCKSLRDVGLTDFMIEVSGDIRAVGKRPGNTPWSVAFELPLPDKSVPIRFMPLIDCAIAGSGNYRHTKNGNGHIISPKTGVPLPASYSSAIIIARTAVEADALATSLFMMGKTEGLEFARQHKLAVTFITQDNDGFKEEGSKQMNCLLKNVED